LGTGGGGQVLIREGQEFKYLGSWIECDSEIGEEIKRRIGQVTSVFVLYRSLVESPNYQNESHKWNDSFSAPLKEGIHSLKAY